MIQMSEGLGDSIDKFTTKTGIKKLVKFLAGEDCGCDTRKEILNKLFPYNRKTPLCLNEEEYNFLKVYFKGEKRFPYVTILTKIFQIHARVFQHYYKSPCTKCKSNKILLDRYTEDLKKIYDNYA